MKITKRKNKKGLGYRGNRTQGYGIHKKHRGGGSKGGKGYGGSKKHKRIGYLKYEPEHFDRTGFISMSKKQNRVFKSINVDELAKLMQKGGEKDIDLTKKNIHKLLGKGKIDFAVTITVDKASVRAIEKVESAGGKVIVKEQKKSKKDTKEKKDKE